MAKLIGAWSRALMSLSSDPSRAHIQVVGLIHDPGAAFLYLSSSLIPSLPLPSLILPPPPSPFLSLLSQFQKRKILKAHKNNNYMNVSP